MIIKETPWETRNLGVRSSVEFYFEAADTLETLDDAVLHNTHYSYQVAHVPVGKIDLVNILLKNGFTFAETKFLLHADLKQFSLSEKFQKIMAFFNYYSANTDELEIINKKMKDGLFDTDKVALDPYFNAHIAGHRYVLWAEDEIKAGRCFPYIVTFESKPVGFFMLKNENEKTGDSFLGGLFDKENNDGLGLATIYFPMLEAKRRGLRRIVTGVSANNPDSVKIHLFLGYQIKTMLYTLVKHI